ncbi:MAG: pseudouridine synthase [Treponema sp.]|nr:pseudouridine synthase [Treponema sp.]
MNNIKIENLNIENIKIENPCIIKETNDYAVVFKPPKMHCAPGKYEYTLLDWYKANSHKVFDIMHRLDYETHGLVLFARNEKSFNFFKELQDNGEFIKGYSAVCSNFDKLPIPELPHTIQSYFRSYGPGRKIVRPVTEIPENNKRRKEIAKDKGGFYKTEIIDINNNVFTLQLKRGFRHQIRCHLCWIGFPILNDPLYPQTETAVNEESGQKALALKAHALYFADPVSGGRIECRIPPLE